MIEPGEWDVLPTQVDVVLGWMQKVARGRARR